MKLLICRSCGLPFQEGEGKSQTTVRGTDGIATMISFADPPYNWSAANGYCLTCWLIYPDPPGVRERVEFANFEQN